MSPRTPEQYEDIRENKKKLIMETAIELFANEGYYPTSISKIADKAGISKGLLYNYFESKEKLLMEILQSGIDEFMDYFDPDKDGNLTDEEFRYFIESVFNEMKNRSNYWKLYMSLALQPTVFKILQHKYRNLVNTTLLIMEKFYKRKKHDNPKMQAMIFGAFMDGLCLNYVMDPNNFPVDEIKEYVIQHYIN